MSTEYTFDGLDEWEKNLAQIIDRQYPEEFKQMVIDIAEQALGKAKELTPVQTGRLRDAWNLELSKSGETPTILKFTIMWNMQSLWSMGIA